MSPSTLIHLLATAIFFCHFADPVQSHCCQECYPHWADNPCRHEGYCNGQAPCDIFCCNCDGACWSDYGHHFVASNVTVNDSKVRFAKYDTDADGFITAEEVFSRGGDKSWDDDAEAREQFATIDGDGDGRISWSEFEKHA